MTSDWHINNAVAAVRQEGVIAYPTEAVWGLGCDPWSLSAVQQIWRLKQRPWHKGLILVASRWQHIQPLIEPCDDEQIERLTNTWPGPNTWLLPDVGNWVPVWIKGQHTSVAVRISAHPLVSRLCDALGGPIVSTSANPAAVAPARTRLKVRQYFGAQLDYVLPGHLGMSRQPTQVRDLLTNKIIRV
ncbi:MAG: Sua5/YciO/YrdC/YwlC family protein [Gammaproteobacteria bacterium]|jgi:L-threonylcarbamoyladenylate synthase|nr:Sua5/YciO/YrdC/YwlC family protein [Gammaproteobacteria bacterium]